MEKTTLEKRIEELKNESCYLEQRKQTALADAIAYAISQGVPEMEFDWDNGDAPSCTYSADEDLMDCYIAKIKFDGDFPLTCTKVTLHAYYVGEDYDISLDDIIDYDKLELANYILDNLED